MRKVHVKVDEDVHKELLRLKIELGKKSISEVIKTLIEVRKEYLKEVGGYVD